MQALMYNPMIMQASCTMYSLVDFCKGENESDLRPVIFPISTPLVSEDCVADLILMNQGRKAANLIGMMGGLPGGIGTLVDVTQLLATVQKVLSNQTTDTVKCETSLAEAGSTSPSDESSILGPPPLMSHKPSTQVSSSHLYFTFNHVLASHIQAQLVQRITMPPAEEPVPPEARIPIASLGGVISLFDLPLVRPLIAKSSQKSAIEHSSDSSQTVTKHIPALSGPVAATGDGILGRPPVPQFQPPQKNAAVPVALGGRSGNIGRFQGPAIRPLAGRNFAGASNWPRPRPGWQWNNETAGNACEGQQWDSGPKPDWNSYSGQPATKPVLSGRNAATVRHRPPVGQSSFSNIRGKPPQV